MLSTGVHSQQSCLAASGELINSSGGVVSLGGAAAFCRFTGGSCPSGWNQYENWSTTVVPACSCVCAGGGCCSGSYTATSVCGSHTYVAVSCSNLHHPWSNTAKESVSAGAKGGGCAWYDCCCCNIYAQITQIGCY